jgi:hypothetical protein
MNDIEPWLDTDAPPDVAESLRAARAEVPRRAVVERCTRLAGMAGVVALSSSVAEAGVAGGGGKALGAVLLAKWGLAGFAAGAVLLGGVELTRRSVAPRVAAPPVPTVAPSSGPAPVATALVAPVLPAASVEPPAARGAPVQRPTGPNADERLTEELSLLSGVREAVDRHDADTALRLLGEHARRYPTDARLLPEARYLRLEALVLGGRREEARDAARRILELDPRGPHAARAREVLEKE